MAKVRMFVAINLSSEVQDKIEETIRGIMPQFRFPIRFLPRGNWHCTLSFLGYQPEEAVPDIEEGIRHAAEKSPISELIFERLTYGPVDSGGKSVTPRMLWILGTKETSEVLGRAKIMLEDAFEAKGIRFERETRLFQAHLTLARFEPQPKGQLPAIERPMRLVSRATSFDLMKSTLRRTGAEYSIYSSFDLRRTI